MRSFWITAAAMATLDQLSKYLVVWQMDLIGRGAIEVLPPFLVFRMGWNRGINFGLFAGADLRWVLAALAVAICVWAFLWVRRDPRPYVLICGGLLVGGALGNVIDRVHYGAVADFRNMSCCGIVNPYTFNLADVGVFAGAIGLVLSPPRTDDGKTA